MEKMKKSIFHFVIICCCGLILLSILFNTNTIPDLQVILQAIGSPIMEFQNPIELVINSFNIIADFFNGGEIPDFIDVLRLFIFPFEFMGTLLRTIVNILRNISEVFN